MTLGTEKKKYLRDRIMLGMADKELSEHLQRHSEDLTLEEAIQAARQSELIKIRMSAQAAPQGTSPNLQEVSQTAGGNANRAGTHRKGSSQKQGQRGNRQPSRQQKQKSHQDPSNCSRCGHKHPGQPCPARWPQCYNCHRHDHFAQMCRIVQQGR